MYTSWTVAEIVMQCPRGILYYILFNSAIHHEQNQKQYSDVRDAFAMIQVGKYEEALNILADYKAGHTGAYFVFQDIVNGKDSIYSMGQVEAAIGQCKKEIYDRRCCPLCNVEG